MMISADSLRKAFVLMLVWIMAIFTYHFQISYAFTTSCCNISHPQKIQNEKHLTNNVSCIFAIRGTLNIWNPSQTPEADYYLYLLCLLFCDDCYYCSDSCCFLHSTWLLFLITKYYVILLRFVLSTIFCIFHFVIIVIITWILLSSLWLLFIVLLFFVLLFSIKVIVVWLLFSLFINILSVSC